MDSLLSFPLLLFSLFLCLFSLLLFKCKTKFSEASLKFPPGPWPLPIIGNIHNIFGSLPHHALRDLSRRYEPVMLLNLGEIPTVIVSSPDAAREIMKTHDISFASRPISTIMDIMTFGGKGIGFSPYGEYWLQLGKICVQELLSTRRVQSYRSIREEEVGNLIKYIFSCASHCQPVNLRQMIVSLLNDISTRAIIGSKCKNQDVLLREINAIVELAAGFNLTDLFPSSRIVRLVSRTIKKAKMSQKARISLLDEVIEQHRERKVAAGESEVEDFLGVLLRLHDRDEHTSSLDMETVKLVILVSPFNTLTACISIHRLISINQ